MKTWKKNGRYIAHLMTVLMIMTAFTAAYGGTSLQNAYADEEGSGVIWTESVYVLGTQVDSSNCDDVLNDGGSVKYDRDTATITLTDAVLDLADFKNTSFNDTNKVYGLSTWQDTNLVLNGTNTIVSSLPSFEPGMEYVYGIEAISGITVSGSGSLSIQIDTADTSSSGIIKYLGIESTGKLSVNGTALSVSMDGSGENCGIQTNWKGFALSNGAEVRAESTGGSNRAVCDSSYRKSTVEYGSSFEMISDSEAFRFSRLPDSVTDGTILVNTEATADNAYDWDKTEDLSTYKYVRLLGSDGGSRASGEVYILGRDIDGELPDTVPHSGNISYDGGSKTLILENAVIDLDNFKNSNAGNLVAGIYTTSDIQIVLKGKNTIKATLNDYGSGTEYVSGIESWGTVNITGDPGASLSVALAGSNSSNSRISITGISADDSIKVNAISLDINMGQYGKCTGIYAWAPMHLANAANVRVSASGSDNTGVNGPNQIGASVISGGSVLEMSSDGSAFNCWTPEDALKQIECLVSSSKDGSPAEEWDRKTSLREFRYVKFTANKGRFGKDVRVLGRKITAENCDDVLGDGTGSVRYDLSSGELTLTDAKLDFANFDHEYDHEEDPDSGTNMITGIDADDDITVILNGRNRILSTKDSFDEKKEYVYGITSGILNTLTIRGEGSLEIAFDKSNEKLNYTGIDVGESLDIKGVAVTVDLGGELKGTGIDVMNGAIKLDDGATLKVNTGGEKSKAVDDQFADDMSIGDGSMFEMISGGTAFNNYFLSQQVTAGGALVNDRPTAEGASAWDRQSYLNKYKYVRLPEDYAHTHQLDHFDAKAATCSEAGNREYWVCWRCGQFFSDEGNTALDPNDVFIPGKGHDWGDWTYKDKAQHQRVCSYDTEGTHIQTENHAWDKGKITKPATLLRKGLKTYTCSACNGTKEEEFSFAEAVKNAVVKAAEKIREWIEKIFSCGCSDDPDVLPTELAVTLSQDTFTYNGKVQKPGIESVMAGDESVEDYTVEYDEGSKDAGSYKVTVTSGIEEYSISGTAEYTIRPAEITDVTVSRTSFTFNGRVQKPAVVSTKAGSLRLESDDCAAVYSDSSSSAAGDYSLTVEGKGNFRGSKTVTYSIKKAANPLSVSGRTAAVKYKMLKKKSQTVRASKVMAISGAQGNVTYALVSVKKARYAKYFRVDKKTGSVTVKKNLRKGIYALTVNVNAAGNSDYNASSKAVVCRIKVE